MTDTDAASIVARLAARNLRDVLFAEHQGRWFLQSADPDAPGERLIEATGMDEAVEEAVRRTLS